jgi:hypothetical protein
MEMQLEDCRQTVANMPTEAIVRAKATAEENLKNGEEPANMQVMIQAYTEALNERAKAGSRIDWAQQVFKVEDRVVSIYDEQFVPGTVRNVFCEEGVHVCKVAFDDGFVEEIGQGDLVPANKTAFKLAYNDEFVVEAAWAGSPNG